MNSSLQVHHLFVCVALVFFGANRAFAQAARPETKPSSTTWSSNLPSWIRKSIVWEANMECGSLAEWHENGPASVGGLGTNPSHGGGILASAQAEAILTKVNVAHTGVFSVKAVIEEATRSSEKTNDRPRHVILRRWLDAQGKQLPTSAYYSTFLYIPEQFSVGNGSWNVLRFMSQDTTRVPEPDSYQVTYSLNIGNSEDRDGGLDLYLWAPLEQKSYDQPTKKSKRLPTKKWVHIEVFCKADSDKSGQIKVWQDGEQLFNIRNIQTLKHPEDRLIFDVANNYIPVEGETIGDDGSATLYFDDTLISKQKVHPYLD